MKNNGIHLCMSCIHDYPDCPAGEHDVDFGDAVGCDNICACSKYEPYYTKADNERLGQMWVITHKHGRLIDADDVDNHILGHVDLSNCPTIIPASD